MTDPTDRPATLPPGSETTAQIDRALESVERRRARGIHDPYTPTDCSVRLRRLPWQTEVASSESEAA